MDTRPVRASYRVQLRDGVTLYDVAERLVDVARLGVSHVHLAPVLAAVPGSTHGYDVVDHDRVDGSLGGDPALEHLAERAAALDLGLVLDIVPNHVAADPRANRRWRDVLALGAASPDAGVFDIDWDDADRLLVPRLGDHYAEVLDRGGVALVRRAAGVDAVVDDDLALPIAPEDAAGLVGAAAACVGDDRAAALARSLARVDAGPASGTSARVDRVELGALLADHLRDHPATAAAVDRHLDEVAADVDALDALLERQHWRLAHWRAAAVDLGYRRFFDVDGLVGVRVEDPAVFDVTHQRIGRWIADGTVEGLRVDHPDGLADPTAYAVALRRLAPGAWITFEKILEGEEALDPRWPVDGTTGYDLATRVTDLLIDPAGLEVLHDLWAGLTGEPGPFADLLHRTRLEVLRSVLQPEVGRLVALLAEVAPFHRTLRDRTAPELQIALEALLACFPVYRTYVVDGPATEQELAAIGTAAAEVRRRHPEVDGVLVELLVDVLAARTVAAPASPAGEAERAFRTRFQQVSGPAMAKGKEDTALYRYAPCAARAEVGSDPGAPLAGPADLHVWCRRATAEAPRTMAALSTHDTKRSEDVRARIAAITHDPEPFVEAVRSALADPGCGARPVPETELLLWQTVVGAWPIDEDRLRAYAIKAAREAKTATSWLDPDEAYEARLSAFVTSLVGDPERRARVDALTRRWVGPGRRLSLAAKLLQLTAAGVPDLYQGTELWDHSLVDPDNRRPVDVDRIAAAIDAVACAGPVGTIGDLDDLADVGLDKLALVVRALAVRAAHPASFAPGAGHEPLTASGSPHRSVVAYRRGDDVIAAVWLRPLDPCRGELALPPGEWDDELVGPGGVPRRWSRTVPLGEAFDAAPVMLLTRAAR